LFTPLFSIQAMWCIQDNTYDVCGKLLGRYPVPTPPRVTFSVEPSAAAAAEAMNKKLSLPDPVLIAIRAACAPVANLSGAAEQADRILRDLKSWRMMGVWLNFFLHACRRRHPDLLAFMGNISHAYQCLVNRWRGHLVLQ
jgi:hypothetical protein